MDNIIKIQSVFRGYLFRRNNLPNSILFIKKFLSEEKIKLNNDVKDGRVNSIKDEDLIKQKLIQKLAKRIVIAEDRMWYDILVKDFRYGWLPINIKTSTLKNADNTGNLTMLLYSLTDFKLDLNEKYNNGLIHEDLFQKISKKEFNNNNKKDYYFLVINKVKTSEVIVNSILGLEKITSNINNLPFQIRWKDNKKYKYHKPYEQSKKIVECIKKSNMSWQDNFITNFRSLKI